MHQHHRSRTSCPGRRASRRTFLTQIGLATAGLLVGGVPTVVRGGTSTTADVAFSNLMSYDRTLIRGTLERMFNDLGGLGDVIKPGDKVGIKINLTGGAGWASSYQQETGLHPGATFWTHPEVLRATCELIQDAGAGQIYVLEAIYDWESYSQYGYKAAADPVGATFIDLNETAPYSDYAVREVGSQAFIYPTFIQNGILNDLDVMVSLAKSKRHNGAGVTHGIKNLVGTLPIPAGIYNDGAGHRQVIHKQTVLDGNVYNNLRRIVLDLHMATPLKLVVNDAIQTVLGGEGPWGGLTTARFDTLIASKDPVAADAVGTQVIGFDPMAPDHVSPFPDGLNYLRLAGTLGMGEYDLNKINLIQTSAVGVEPDAESELSAVTRLENYPNPFRSKTTFHFSLSQGGFTTIVLHDLNGRRIRTLVARSLPAGVNQIDWNGRNDYGRPAPSGLYLARLSAGGQQRTRKVALVR